jgi:hypothetical protein
MHYCPDVKIYMIDSSLQYKRGHYINSYFKNGSEKHHRRRLFLGGKSLVVALGVLFYLDKA